MKLLAEVVIEGQLRTTVELLRSSFKDRHAEKLFPREDVVDLIKEDIADIRMLREALREIRELKERVHG